MELKKNLDVNGMPPPHKVSRSASAKPTEYSWTAEIKKQKTFLRKIRVALFHGGFMSNRLFVAVMIISSLFVAITAWVVIGNSNMTTDYFIEQHYDQR